MTDEIRSQPASREYLAHCDDMGFGEPKPVEKCPLCGRAMTYFGVDDYRCRRCTSVSPPVAPALRIHSGSAMYSVTRGKSDPYPLGALDTREIARRRGVL